MKTPAIAANGTQSDWDYGPIDVERLSIRAVHYAKKAGANDATIGKSKFLAVVVLTLNPEENEALRKK